jgi:hypothetical protein
MADLPTEPSLQQLRHQARDLRARYGAAIGTRSPRWPGGTPPGAEFLRLACLYYQDDHPGRTRPLTSRRRGGLRFTRERT